MTLKNIPSTNPHKLSAERVAKVTKALVKELIKTGVLPAEPAKPSLDAGMLSIIHAFNLTDDPGHGYGFPAETRALAEAMLRDLYKLFQEGEIKPRAAALLETDQPFQRFMQRVRAPSR
jgi:hypothetical protein